MFPETPKLEPEIAHILSIDVVGYSKLLVNEQVELLNELKRVVRETRCACAAEDVGRLIRLPTGDGMVLLFFGSPEEPLQCAVEIAEGLRALPHIQVRMGLHSGPVNKIEDVNDRLNVAGAGINIAQRVLDSGDAGHILLSKRLADDLREYSHWHAHLHDLGECVVKHGLRLHLVNFHNGSCGNPERPLRLQDADKQEAAKTRKLLLSRRAYLWLSVLASLLLLGAMAEFVYLHQRHGPKIPEKSVAVLPFENWGSESKDAYFADGVQGEILTLLMKVRDLKVISRASVMRYSDVPHLDLEKVSRQLGVRYVLEGSVQRVGDQVRVGAQLVDSQSGTQLWANRYDRNLRDVFRIQTEIAEKIVTQLEAKFTPEEKAAIEEPPTNDLLAYDFYLRGKAIVARVVYESSRTDDLLDSARLFEEATVRDPAFFLAYCQLANVHDQIFFYSIDPSPRRLALAQAAVDAAVRLHPDFGETHLALATHYYFGYRDYERARQELVLAENKLPNDPQPIVLGGYIDRRQGRWAASMARLKRALELDPRNLVYLKQLAHSSTMARDYPSAREYLDRALAIVPADPALQVQRATIALDARADPDPLRRAVETVLSHDPRAGATIADSRLTLALCQNDVVSASAALATMDENGAYEESVPLPKQWVAGVIARLRQDRSASAQAFRAARESLAHIPETQPNFAEGLSALGMIDAALGDRENAVREGRRSVELLPTNRDAIVGPILQQNLAVIYAWSGHQREAMETLRSVLSQPSYLSYGQLKLHPYWTPLRGDPEFEKILAGIAPVQQ